METKEEINSRYDSLMDKAEIDMSLAARAVRLPLFDVTDEERERAILYLRKVQDRYYKSKLRIEAARQSELDALSE